MVRNAKPTFSLRLFFAFCIAIGLLCVFEFYSLAIALFAATLLHFALLLMGRTIANKYPHGRNPLLRHQFVRPLPGNEVSIVITICYLVFFYCWHMLPLFFSQLNIQMIWYPPTIFGLSLNMIEHCSIAMLHVFIYVNYFGECFGTGYVNPRNCAMTSSFSVTLLATHFAVPHT